jgi:dolichyl-phosphate beta-glucosyltransferase
MTQPPSFVLRSFTYEMIIVDDGSKDGTSGVALDYVRKYGDDKVRLCKLFKNCGKGGAVRKVGAP